MTEIQAPSPGAPAAPPVEKASTTPVNKGRYRQTPFEQAGLKHITNVNKPTDEDEEADKHFLLSFLPMMKKLPVDQKLWVRMKFNEAMQQVMQVRHDYSPANFPPPRQQWQDQNNYQNYGPTSSSTSERDQQIITLQSSSISDPYSPNSDVFSVIADFS